MDCSIALLEEAGTLIDQRTDPVRWGLVMNNLAIVSGEERRLDANNIERARRWNRRSGQRGSRVAFADGHLSVEESKLIHEVADWIEIDRKSRATWKRNVHTALDGGTQRGLTYKGAENLDLW